MLVQDTLTGYLHEVPDAQMYGSQYGEYPEPVGEVVYDGFGNPVGLPFLAPLAAKLLPTIASKVLPAAARALPGIIRGATGALRRFAPVAQAAQRALPGVIRQFTPAVQAFQRAIPGALQQLAPAAQAYQQVLPGTMQQFLPAAQAFQQALPGAIQQLQPVAQAAQEAYGPDAGGEFAEVPMPMMQPTLRTFVPPGWIPRPHPYTGLPPRRLYMRCVAWRGPTGLVPASAARTQPSAILPPLPGAAVGLRRPSRVRRRR